MSLAVSGDLLWELFWGKRGGGNVICSTVPLGYVASEVTSTGH